MGIGGMTFGGDPFGKKPFGFGEEETGPGVASGAPSMEPMQLSGSAYTLGDHNGIGVLTLPAFVMDGSCIEGENIDLPCAITLPGMTAAGLAGKNYIANTGYMGVGPAMICEGSAVSLPRSQGIVIHPAMQADGSARNTRPSIGSPAMRAFTAHSVATVTTPKTSSGAAAMRAFTAHGAGTFFTPKTASGSPATKAFTAHGAGTFFTPKTASGSPDAPAMQADGIGVVVPLYVPVAQTSAGGGSAAGMTAAGIAQNQSIASGAMSLPAQIAAGLAFRWLLNDNAGNGVLPAFQAAGMAGIQRYASGAGIMPAQTLAGVCFKIARGGGALPAFAGAGAGAVSRPASGAVATIPGMTAAGDAQRVPVATCAIVLPAQTAAGVPRLSHYATGAIVLPNFYIGTLAGNSGYEGLQLYRVSRITWVDDDPFRHAILEAVKMPVARSHASGAEHMLAMAIDGGPVIRRMTAAGVAVVVAP
ncbi:MAG TPA: hypothetical protein PLD40_07825 [Kiritimatiellia bacterium]|nr:hypothetical protein [Kiritimatiellia bacterium]